jgi:hypothetical protein
MFFFLLKKNKYDSFYTVITSFFSFNAMFFRPKLPNPEAIPLRSNLAKD